MNHEEGGHKNQSALLLMNVIHSSLLTKLSINEVDPAAIPSIMTIPHNMILQNREYYSVLLLLICMDFCSI